MKGIIWILFILFFVDLSAQNQSNITNVFNKLTKKHIRIPGTHLYLIPPKGFEISETFLGLTNHKNTNISVMDLSGNSFYDQSKEFTKETFEKTGLTVYNYKELKINNCNAKYLYTNSLNSNDKNLMLAFGDSTFTILITANLSADADKNFKEVEKCLLSAFYNKSITINPLETARFEFDLSRSDYRFEKLSSGLFFYSIKKTEHENDNQQFFIVSQMPYQDATDEVLKLSTKQMIDKAIGYEDLKLDFKKLELNGCKAIETTGYGKMKGEKILYYLLVVGKQNNITIVNSLIQNDYEENLKKLTDLSHTIKLK